MEVNNFKELERELMAMREPQLQKIQHNITESRSVFQAIGDVVELFFPKVIEVLIRMTGSNPPDTQESKYPHEAP